MYVHFLSIQFSLTIMDETKRARVTSEASEEPLRMEEELGQFLYEHPCVYIEPDSGDAISSVYSPLHTAVRFKREDLVKYIVQEKIAGVDDECIGGMTPMIFAVEDGDISMIRLLIELGSDLNIRERSNRPLWHAALVKNHSVIRLLVDHGADATRPELTVFRKNGRGQIMDFIEDLFTEKLFSKVITGGIQSRGQFRDFLAEGVCDARLLIHIANFAYH